MSNPTPSPYPKKTLFCPEKDCKYTARRPLQNIPGCRGHYETPAEKALCPHGHGPLVEKKP